MSSDVLKFAGQIQIADAQQKEEDDLELSNEYAAGGVVGLHGAAVNPMALKALQSRLSKGVPLTNVVALKSKTIQSSAFEAMSWENLEKLVLRCPVEADDIQTWIGPGPPYVKLETEHYQPGIITTLIDDLDVSHLNLIAVGTPQLNFVAPQNRLYSRTLELNGFKVSASDVKEFIKADASSVHLVDCIVSAEAQELMDQRNEEHYYQSFVVRQSYAKMQELAELEAHAE